MGMMQDVVHHHHERCACYRPTQRSGACDLCRWQSAKSQKLDHQAMDVQDEAMKLDLARSTLLRSRPWTRHRQLLDQEDVAWKKSDWCGERL